MLRRLKAQTVAAALGSGLGVAVGILMSLPNPSLDLPIAYHLSVLAIHARIGAVAGLAFALLLLGWFRATRRIPGVPGSVVLGAIALLIGVETFRLTSFTPTCGTASMTTEYLTWIVGVGGPCGGLVGAAARPGPDEVRAGGPAPLPLEERSTSAG